MTEINETEAQKRMEAYCASAEHCRTEVTDKLLRWGLPYDTANRIVDKLEQEKFIDEERYCNAFIHDKFRFAKWGKVKIAEALKLKKIPFYVYHPYLEKINEDEYLATLNALLTSKKKSVHAATPYELNGKLVRFAMSRGFEMKDIARCIDVEEEAPQQPAES